MNSCALLGAAMRNRNSFHQTKIVSGNESRSARTLYPWVRTTLLYTFVDKAHTYWLSTSDSLEVNLVRWSAAAVVEFAKDPSERLARVVYRSVAPRPRHHHLARLEHQRRRLWLVLINQTDDLQMPRRKKVPKLQRAYNQQRQKTSQLKQCWRLTGVYAGLGDLRYFAGPDRIKQCSACCSDGQDQLPTTLPRFSTGAMPQ